MIAAIAAAISDESFVAIARMSKHPAGIASRGSSSSLKPNTFLGGTCCEFLRASVSDSLELKIDKRDVGHRAERVGDN